MERNRNLSQYVNKMNECEECNVKNAILSCTKCAKQICGNCSQKAMQIHVHECKIDVDLCVICMLFYSSIDIHNPGQDRANDVLVPHTIKKFQSFNDLSCSDCIKSHNIKGD